MYKSREDLLKELEDVKADRDEALECARKSEAHIRELHTELEELKKVESMKEDCDVAARQIKIMHDSFVNAEFTDSQAFGLLTSIIPAVLSTATMKAPSVDPSIKGIVCHKVGL